MVYIVRNRRYGCFCPRMHFYRIRMFYITAPLFYSGRHLYPMISKARANLHVKPFEHVLPWWVFGLHRKPIVRAGAYDNVSVTIAVYSFEELVYVVERDMNQSGRRYIVEVGIVVKIITQRLV